MRHSSLIADPDRNRVGEKVATAEAVANLVVNELVMPGALRNVYSLPFVAIDAFWGSVGVALHPFWNLFTNVGIRGKMYDRA